jgi:murein DD-endopeptidase MepM/ murein hydrolase activator NlpD
MRRAAVIAFMFLLAGPGISAAATSQLVVRQVGRLTIRADQTLAFPGGLVSIQLHSRRAIGGVIYAILDGRRCPFFYRGGTFTALVPIPSTFTAGPATVGVEIRGGRGRQRIAVPITITPRGYRERTVVIPELKRPLVTERAAVRDGRQVQQLLRTVSSERQWRGPFQPPVAAEPLYSYGAPMSYVGASPVEASTDSIHGEYHRGLDYGVPVGTVVQAPAPGTVLLARRLALTGHTLILDHGQGVISALFHLSRIDVLEGDWVEGRAPIALSGESGVAAEPHLHWAVYVLGVAVDPRVMERLAD